MQTTNVILFSMAAALGGAGSTTLPVPPQSAAVSDASAFLFYAGAGDIFEISSSMTLLNGNPDARTAQFASMLIADHTQLTNAALAAAKQAGVAAPPPELSAMQKADLATLRGAAPAQRRSVYFNQQVAAHRQALDMMRGYAANGDQAAMRQAAQSAIPVIERHLAEAQTLAGQAPR